MKHRPEYMSQRSFASSEFALKKRVTRREKFLGEMEQGVPWVGLGSVVEPMYPTSGRVGGQPIGVARMLRMYFLQQWFGLGHRGPGGAVLARPAVGGFVGG